MQRLEKRSLNEKFIASAAIVIVFLTFSSIYIPAYAFAAIFPVCLVLLIALAYHWDFPQIVRPLNDLLNHYMRKGQRAKSRSPDEMSPADQDDEAGGTG